MSKPIFHHYQGSPFAEKIRLIFGLKAIAYHSVFIPQIMPKPDLIALTGGYRRTPVLQIGADIYCDTRLIARMLDRLSPAPPLYPPKQEAAAETLAFWADDHLFRIGIAVCFSPEGMAGFETLNPKEAMEALIKDRQAMVAAATAPPIHVPLDVATAQLQVLLSGFDAQLKQGGQFLLGSDPCIADFSFYHILWFLQGNPALAPKLAPYEALGAWMKRMAAFGHGAPDKMSSQQALDEARAASPQPSEMIAEADGLNAGDRVIVTETALGIDPVEGDLVCAAQDEIIIRRQSEKVGEVAVHFPRMGYRLSRAADG